MLSLQNRTDYQTLLDGHALKASDAVAIRLIATTHAPITVTYSELRENALRVGASFQQSGLGTNDLVVIAHPNILTSIYAFWGALAIGAIPSMFPTLTEKLDPQIYTENLSELIRLSQVKAVVTSDDFAKTLPPLPCEILTYSRLSQETINKITPQSTSSIAFLQHSSGTTGLQKGVALSHEAVLNQLASYSDVLKLCTDDVIVSWLPLYHDMGLIAGFLLPLVQGIPLVLMSPFDWIAHPAMLLQAIDDYNGTLCWLPNFAYNHMARRIRKRDREGLSLASMRAFINCSEPVSHDSHQKFLDTFSETNITADHLQVSYAMAENTFAVTQTPLGQAPTLDHINPEILAQARQAVSMENGRIIVSCGYPIPETTFKIVNEDNQLCDERYVGEILVQSDCMLTDYYRRPDLQPFTNEWYRTGDMGYLADGQLYIIGRKKDIIINAGKNVYPQDIEDVVNTIEGVYKGRCVVFGVFDEREGTERIAVVAERDDKTSATEKELKKAIRRRIAEQTTVAATFVTIIDNKWLIKTSSGKIARAANREKWLSEFGGYLL